MNNADLDITPPEVPTTPLPNEQPDDPLEYAEQPDPVEQEIVEEEEELPLPQVKPIVPDNAVFDDAPAQAPPKRAKRPISDKQREHLAKIRVKALEAKRAKQSQKPKNKSAKKVYEEQVEEEHDTFGSVPEPVKPARDSPLYQLTQKQLRDLQMEAIYGYDMVRKDRKQKKQQALAEEEQKQQTFQAVNRAVGGGNPSVFDGLFQ